MINKFLFILIYQKDMVKRYNFKFLVSDKKKQKVIWLPGRQNIVFC